MHPTPTTALLFALFLLTQAGLAVSWWTRLRNPGRAPSGQLASELSAGLCVLALAALIGLRTPVGGPIGLLGDLAAAALLLGSGALLAWTLRALPAEHRLATWPAGLPRPLATRGPYRWVRQPFFWACLLGQGAALAASQSPWCLPLLGWMVLVMRIAALREERELRRSPRRTEFSQLEARTGRFLPRLKPAVAVARPAAVTMVSSHPPGWVPGRQAAAGRGPATPRNTATGPSSASVARETATSEDRAA